MTSAMVFSDLFIIMSKIDIYCLYHDGHGANTLKYIALKKKTLRVIKVFLFDR